MTRQWRQFASARAGPLITEGRGYGHLRKFIEMTFPWVEWNPWMERTMRVIADDDYAQQIGETKLKFINLTGPGSASKTFSAGFSPVLVHGRFFVRRAPHEHHAHLYEQRHHLAACVADNPAMFSRSLALGPAHGQSAKFHWAHMVDSQKT